MDGFLQLGPDDLTTPVGVAKLNNMLQALFNSSPGDGVTVQDLSGYGSPNSVVTASVGSTYRQIDGAAGSSLYIKSSGSGNTGWTAIPSLPLSIANGGTGTTTGVGWGIVVTGQTINTIYGPLATDGIVKINFLFNASGKTVSFLNDTSATPTTVKSIYGQSGGAFVAGNATFTEPVKAASYYQVTSTDVGLTLPIYEFWPL